MYPQEPLTLEEANIVFRIRQLIGDEKEIFVDELNPSNQCNKLTSSGTLYQLDQPKGYPLNVNVNGVEIVESGALTVSILGYKYLQFSSSIAGSNMTVIYNHFSHSDSEIIDTYDTAAYTYLTGQCGLSASDLGVDLLTLSTAMVLLTIDLTNYIKSAVRLKDSDSEFEATYRPRSLKDLLDLINKELKTSLAAKMNCKMLSLPVYKVE